MLKIKKFKKITTLITILSMISIMSISASALQGEFSKKVSGSSNFKKAWSKSFSVNCKADKHACLGKGYYAYDTHYINEDVCHFTGTTNYYNASIVTNAKGSEFQYVYSGTTNVWKRHSGTNVRYRVIVGGKDEVKRICNSYK